MALRAGRRPKSGVLCFLLSVRSAGLPDTSPILVLHMCCPRSCGGGTVFPTRTLHRNSATLVLVLVLASWQVGKRNGLTNAQWRTESALRRCSTCLSTRRQMWSSGPVVGFTKSLKQAQTLCGFVISLPHIHNPQTCGRWQDFPFLHLHPEQSR